MIVSRSTVLGVHLKIKLDETGITNELSDVTNGSRAATEITQDRFIEV